MSSDAPGSACGATRRSRSANEGPGSSPGPKNGNDGSVIDERAYTDPARTNSLTRDRVTTRAAVSRATYGRHSSERAAGRRSRFEAPDVVAELPESAVAVEAEDPSNEACRVIVVDVSWGRSTADCALAALLPDETIHLLRADPIPACEVVVAGSPVKALSRLATTRVVTQLAVRRQPVLGPLVARELLGWLPLAAIRATL